MDDELRVTPRQIWANPTTTTTKTYSSGCTPFALPSDGIIHVNKSFVITLTHNAVYEPICTGQTPNDYTHVDAVLDTRDPFYSSVTPQLYAIGCCTVVSYVLVIILLITPRTFFVGGPGGGGANFLGRHGMMTGSYSGNSSIVGVGGRPWLQKVAALLAAVSLTIATVDSFRVAEQQYKYGYSDAEALSEEVIDGMEIRIVRVISQTFLWLAQVQTLIRLFPRHKEKVMIKWAGFALIVLDTTFSILENFFFKNTSTHPRLYDDAIPALSYLFELALNLLYAAWVIFYSISKHRYAFFHPKMRNICFVALLSFCAVLIPVVFFVMDIAKPEIAGWGTYIRWVGSAAASVVVWEWVERIEALERDETKDGILGREVFDGDEMLDVTPSEEVDWPRYSSHGHDKGAGNGSSSAWGGVINLAQRPLRTRVGINRSARNRAARMAQGTNDPNATQRRSTHRPTPPPAVITPVSRADTSSAPSTVYNVRYHPVSSPTPPVAMPHMEEEEAMDENKEMEIEQQSAEDQFQQDPSSPHDREQSPQIVQTDPRWRNLINHFKRRRASLPKEVAFAQAGEEQADENNSDSSSDEQEQPPVQPRSNNGFFNSLQRGRLPGSGPPPSDAPLPVTVIPARRRGQQTWSPQPQNGLLDAPPSTQREQRPGVNPNPNLPVRVIPSQPQASAPWDDSEFQNGDNYVLRYDPEAAALVHEHVSHTNLHSQEEPIVTSDRASWTQTTISEADSHDHDDGAEPGPSQHNHHGHLSS